MPWTLSKLGTKRGHLQAHVLDLSIHLIFISLIWSQPLAKTSVEQQ